MAFWPRPDRLLPPRLVESLAAALAGDMTRALQLSSDADARDPLAGDVVRLVRGLAALEGGDRARGLRDLRALSHSTDPALELLATNRLVEDAIAHRRFAAAQPLARRLRERQTDAAARVWSETLWLALELGRQGTLSDAALAPLRRRLDRRLPAAVHAAVHLLRAERALLVGDLAEAVAAGAEARPHVRAAGLAVLRRRYDAVTELLRAPFAEVEDWEEPQRPVSREEVAALESRPWQLWADGLHRRVRARARRGGTTSAALAAVPDVWEMLVLLLRTPRRRLAWSQAGTLLGATPPDAVPMRGRVLAEHLAQVGVALEHDAEGCRLDVERTVLLMPAISLAPLEKWLLSRLAERGTATAASLLPRGVATALVARGSARRTVVEHLARLRRAGYVRMVGGGREARYALV